VSRPPRFLRRWRPPALTVTGMSRSRRAVRTARAGQVFRLRSRRAGRLGRRLVQRLGAGRRWRQYQRHDVERAEAGHWPWTAFRGVRLGHLAWHIVLGHLDRKPGLRGCPWWIAWALCFVGSLLPAHTIGATRIIVQGRYSHAVSGHDALCSKPRGSILGHHACCLRSCSYRAAGAGELARARLRQRAAPLVFCLRSIAAALIARAARRRSGARRPCSLSSAGFFSAPAAPASGQANRP
jgi:hypothetical protein